jgi:cell division protein FtsQ
MNAEPETYPPEALADEEPRYLRRQKPLEIRRRKFARKNWPAYRRWLIVGAGILGGGLAAYQSGKFFTSSPTVRLANYDQIDITGLHYVNRISITEKFADDLGKSVLRVPLDARRAAIEQIPWIGSASARRVLPNHIRVEVSERTPVAFLRTSNDLALVDANGVILDRPLEGDFRFPVVSGIDESMPLADRAKRVQMLVQFLKEIDLARPGASEHISEISLSDAEDIRATVAGLPGLEEQPPIVVHFGDSGFVNKYNLLLDNIGPWHASAGQVESVDLRFPRQVVVNPESGTRTRGVALHASPVATVRKASLHVPARAPERAPARPKHPAKLVHAAMREKTHGTQLARRH